MFGGIIREVWNGKRPLSGRQYEPVGHCAHDCYVTGHPVDWSYNLSKLKVEVHKRWL